MSADEAMPKHLGQVFPILDEPKVIAALPNVECHAKVNYEAISGIVWEMLMEEALSFKNSALRSSRNGDWWSGDVSYLNKELTMPAKSDTCLPQTCTRISCAICPSDSRHGKCKTSAP